MKFLPVVLLQSLLLSSSYLKADASSNDGIRGLKSSKSNAKSKAPKGAKAGKSAKGGSTPPAPPGFTSDMETFYATDKNQAVVLESLGMDCDGNVFAPASLHYEILKITPDADMFTVGIVPYDYNVPDPNAADPTIPARPPNCMLPGGVLNYAGNPDSMIPYAFDFPLPGLGFGMVMDGSDGNLYYSIIACNEGMPNPPVPNPLNGIWKIDSATGETTQVCTFAYPDRGDPAECCINSFGPQYTYPELINSIEVVGDYVYFTNTYYGEIYRAPKNGGSSDVVAELWGKWPEFARRQTMDIELHEVGLHGIKWANGAFHVTHTYTGEIWKIDVVKDEQGDISPGALTLIYHNEGPFTPDEFDMDIHGRYWVADFFANNIAVIEADGSNFTTFDFPEIDRPSAVKFGRGADSDTLYITNSAFIMFPPYVQQNPGLLKIKTNTKGYEREDAKCPSKKSKSNKPKMPEPDVGFVEHLKFFDQGPFVDPTGFTNGYPTDFEFDAEDNAYISIAQSFKMVKMTPEGEFMDWANFPGADLMELCRTISATIPEFGGLLVLPSLAPFGTTIDDEEGVLYTTVNLCIEADPRNGIYKVDLAAGGEAEQVIGIPRSNRGTFINQVPDIWNGLTHHDGNFYISNSYQGEVWCAPMDGSANATLWSEDDLIKDLEGVFEGSNGIEFHEGDIYVSNSGTGKIIKLGIPEGTGCGQASSAEVYADVGVGCDSFAFAADGSIFCAAAGVQQLLDNDLPEAGVFKWTPGDEKGVQILDRSDFYFDVTNAVRFGRVGENRHQLYIANSGYLNVSPSLVSHPSFVRVKVAEMGA